MKKLFVIFSLIFCVSGWGQHVSVYEGFSVVNDDSSYAERLTQAKQLATVYMNDYKSFLSRKNLHNFSSIMEMMVSSLRSAIFMVSSSESTENDNSRCRNNGGGLVNLLDPSRLYFCAITKQDSIHALVQTIVHEAYHLYEAAQQIRVSIDESEYNAADFEVAVLQSSPRRCLAFKTTYHVKYNLNPTYCR